MTEETTLRSKIPPAWDGKSLLDFLSHRFRYHSPEEWTALIRKGSVVVNGALSSPETQLKRKDVVSYSVVLREPPVDGNVTILHEEDTFLVACKPGNLPSHADGNFIKHTFIFIMREMLRERGYAGPLNLVHRLDRETSGLMVVAKDPAAHRDLSRQFEAGSVTKEYLAVARGVINSDGFEITGAIAPDSGSSISIRRRVVPDGTPGASSAFTRFVVLDRFRDATLLRCLPHTGRTNQIRVHLDHAGHPLVGDKLYGRTDAEFLEFVNNARAGNFAQLPWLAAPRHLLHASVLSFRHPLDKIPLRFEAPLPDDMRGYISRAKS
jgi:RluA family pseudouridine synthase